ncbi:MAG: hypothetical protein ACLQU4_01115 [Limisphaerales bacterium]
MTAQRVNNCADLKNPRPTSRAGDGVPSQQLTRKSAKADNRNLEDATGQNDVAIALRSKEFKARLWEALGWPIRPDPSFVNRLVSLSKLTGDALLLGATPLLANRLLQRGYREVTVVDKSRDSLELFFKEVGGQRKDIIPVCREWVRFVTQAQRSWDCVFMDNGMFFLPIQQHETLIYSIANLLRRSNGSFISRQMVVGSRSQCRSDWKAMVELPPSKQSISTLYLANAIIASRFGKCPVNYRHLQRLGRLMLQKLERRWGDRLPRKQVDLIDTFLRTDVRCTSFQPELQRLQFLPELEASLSRHFRKVEVLPVEGRLGTFQRIFVATL